MARQPDPVPVAGHPSVAAAAPAAVLAEPEIPRIGLFPLSILAHLVGIVAGFGAVMTAVTMIFEMTRD